MMKLRSLFVCMALVLASTLAFAADPVEGYWKSIDEKTGEVTAIWNIYQKDGVLYGVIKKLPDKPDDTIAVDVKASYRDFPVSGVVNQMTVLNTPWIWGLSSRTPGAWAGGNIIDPKDGNLYKCKITFRPADGKKFSVDTLEMRGEIGFGIGRSQYWVRSSAEEIQ